MLFGIDEHPLDVMRFYEENIQYSFGEYETSEIRKRWESYLKAFF